MEKQTQDIPQNKGSQPQQQEARRSYSDDLNKVPHPETLDPQAEKFAGSSLSTEANLDKEQDKDDDTTLDDNSSKKSQVDSSRSTQKDNRLS